MNVNKKFLLAFIDGLFCSPVFAAQRDGDSKRAQTQPFVQEAQPHSSVFSEQREELQQPLHSDEEDEDSDSDDDFFGMDSQERSGGEDDEPSLPSSPYSVFSLSSSSSSSSLQI